MIGVCDPYELLKMDSHLFPTIYHECCFPTFGHWRSCESLGLKTTGTRESVLGVADISEELSEELSEEFWKKWRILISCGPRPELSTKMIRQASSMVKCCYFITYGQNIHINSHFLNSGSTPLKCSLCLLVIIQNDLNSLAYSRRVTNLSVPHSSKTKIKSNHTREPVGAKFPLELTEMYDSACQWISSIEILVTKNR